MSHQVAGFFFGHWLFHPLWGRGYQFWSGIAGCFVGIGWLSAVAAYLRRHNCHHHWCPWPGRFLHSTHGLLCKKHHLQAGGQIPGKHYELVPPGDAEQHGRTPDGS